MISDTTNDLLEFIWLDEDHESAPKANMDAVTERPFRPRRSHTKSRSGCQNCKRRRIKCDEGKPDCIQCQKHDITCHYLPAKGTCLTTRSPNIGSTQNDHPWLTTKEFSMALDLITDQYANMLYPNRTQPANRSLVTTLQHFESTAYMTLGSPAHQKILRKHAISLSQDTPFLLHAIFAYSAQHLEHLQPSNLQHAIDATYHQQKAIQLYIREPAALASVSKLDSWFAAYMILAALAFYHPFPPSDAYSFLHSHRAQGIDWLNVTGMLGSLLQNKNLKSYLPQSVWLPVFLDIDDGARNFTDFRPGPIDLDPTFASLCGITSTSTIINNHYHAALRLLTPMLRITPSIETFSKLITFPCRMQPAFIELYRMRDPVALLIMAHWFALMSGIPHWWCESRAKTECLAICNYLEGWPDERLRKLLRFPMEKCGYVAIDEDMIQMCVFGM